MLNPSHFVSILANLPSRGVEEISMHSPLGHLGIFFTESRRKEGIKKGDEGALEMATPVVPIQTVSLFQTFSYFVCTKLPTGQLVTDDSFGE